MRISLKLQTTTLKLPISNLISLSINRFVCIASEYCKSMHSKTREKCSALVLAAQIIRENGVCQLSDVYRQSFPQEEAP